MGHCNARGVGAISAHRPCQYSVDKDSSVQCQSVDHVVCCGKLLRFVPRLARRCVCNPADTLVVVVAALIRTDKADDLSTYF